MKFFVFSFLLVLQVSRLAFAAEGNFFFRDQKNWGTEDNDCDKEENSPIDIIDDEVIHDSKLDEPFTWSASFLSNVEKLSCKNTGQSYTCTVGGASTPLTMQGGNLIKTPMTLLQFHVHFGSSTHMAGSEHRINGHQYPAEIHFVFTGNGYSSEFTDYGSLAVWGFFIDIASKDYKAQGSLNTVLDTISKHLWEYAAAGTGKNLDGQIDLSEIIPLTNYHAMGSFYRYKGGLTTPGCNQVVQWTVFQNPLYISEEQYLLMTGGKTWPNNDGDVEDMIDTFRVPQPLNGRPVTATKFAMQGMNRHGSGDQTSSKVAATSSFCTVLALAVAKLMTQ